MAMTRNASTKSKSKSSMYEWMRFLIIVVLVFGAGYIILHYVPFVAKYEMYVIKTGSMVPVINVGDVVIIDTSVNLDNLKPGEIIAVKADINNDGTKEIVVHYLNSVSQVDGVRVFRTSSEKTTLDTWVLHDSDIVGIKVMTIPKIGPIIMFSQSTIGRIILIADIIIIFAVIEYFAKTKKNKKNEIDTDTKEMEDSKE
jgi:signal peptidase